MKKHALLFLAVCALRARAQESAAEIESRVAFDIKQAREDVDRCKRAIADRDKEAAAAKGPYDVALAAHTAALNARNKAQGDIAKFKATLDAATAALDGKIARAKAEYDASRAALNAKPNDSSLRNDLIANTFALNALENRRDKVLAGLGSETRMAALRTALDRTDNPYWDTKRDLVHAASDYEMQKRILEKLHLDLAAAEDRLLQLRIDAVQKLTGSTPPHLEVVEARSEGKVVYRAQWVPAADVVDERIAFMKRAIEFQKAEIRTQTGRRDEWLDLYVTASDEVQVKIRAYESAIWSQAWKSIAIDLGDAAISVALDWEKMGPFAVAYQALEKTADAVSGTIKGDFKKRYDLPVSTSEAPPPFSTPAVQSWFTDAGIDRYKNLVRVALEGVSGGEFQALDHYDTGKLGKFRFTVPKLDQADLWVIVKREAMEGGGEALVVKRVLNPESVRGAWKTMRSAFRETSARQLAGDFKARLKTKAFWKEFGKGVAIDFAKDLVKSAAHDAARDERFAVWEEFLAADAYALAIYRQLDLESKMLRSEHVQLKGYLKYLQELVDEREQVLNQRLLKVETDEVAAGRELDVTLTFSREVANLEAKLGGEKVELTGSGKTWTGKATLKGESPTAPLWVKGVDELSKKPLDGGPQSVPRWDTKTAKWLDVEATPDESHRIKRVPLQPGISIVILVDCSGSMKEQDRMKNAKEAAAKALQPGTLTPDDEIALWAFFGSGKIQLLVPFTKDPAAVLAKIQTLQPDGNTPLAGGILEAGGYAMTHGKNQRKLLMVFSDGQESCNGNPGRALRRVQEMGVETK